MTFELFGSNFSCDADFKNGCFAMFRVEINGADDVDGIVADEIDDGLDTVEIFLCNSCFFNSL